MRCEHTQTPAKEMPVQCVVTCILLTAPLLDIPRWMSCTVLHWGQRTCTCVDKSCVYGRGGQCHLAMSALRCVFFILCTTGRVYTCTCIYCGATPSRMQGRLAIHWPCSIQCTCTWTIKYIEHYLERKEKGKKEKERKLQQPQRLRKMQSVQLPWLRKIESAQPLHVCFRKRESVQPPHGLGK